VISITQRVRPFSSFVVIFMLSRVLLMVEFDVM
jgi:hypothetical protein